MSERSLKPGWSWVKFGDMVRQVKDKVDPQTSGLKRYVAGEHMNTDDLRIRCWGEINEDYLGPAFNMHFKPGQVLYGSRRTYLRKVAVPHFEGICANTTFVLEAKDPNLLMPELLPFIMRTEAFHEHSIKQSKGSVNPYVNFSDLAWWEFAFPPLEEQRKLLMLLSTIETQFQHIEIAEQKANLCRKSYLENIFDEQGETYRLDEIAKIMSGGTPSKSRQDYWNGNIPWLSPKDMKTSILMDTEDHISEEGLQAGSKLAPPESIFITVRGMILAHTFPVCRSKVPMAFNQDIKAIVVSSDYEPAYVQAWFEWAAARYLRLVSETSHGTKRLEMDQLLLLRIPKQTLTQQLKELCLIHQLDEVRYSLAKRRSKLAVIRHTVLNSA